MILITMNECAGVKPALKREAVAHRRGGFFCNWREVEQL
jgi:hypothetical protein